MPMLQQLALTVDVEVAAHEEHSAMPGDLAE